MNTIRAESKWTEHELNSLNFLVMHGMSFINPGAPLAVLSDLFAIDF